MSDRTTTLAIFIADDAASSDIECMCLPVGAEPETIESIQTCWHDINRLTDPEYAQYVATAVEYLDGRKLLKRHPENANWVRPIHNYTQGKIMTTNREVEQATGEADFDDSCVDNFAVAMKEKLMLARQKGRAGWLKCSQEELSTMLREHVDKGDPRDVANFCMFLWSIGCAVSPPQAQTARDLPEGFVLVPIEPTANMVIAGFESAPDRVFGGDEYPEEYDDMSGCQQAAFRAKRCWSAMISAAQGGAKQ